MQRALERRVRKARAPLPRRDRRRGGCQPKRRQAESRPAAARARVPGRNRRIGWTAQELPFQGFRQREAKQADAAASALQSAQNNATLKEISLGYKEITIQSIQHIQPFACETLDAAGSRARADAHRKLLLEARKVPLGTEKARCYGLDEAVSGYFTGEQEGGVHIPNFSTPHIAIHNHPSGMTFSPEDILGFASRDSMQMLTIVGNDGSVYALEKTAATDLISLNGCSQCLNYTNDPTMPNTGLLSIILSHIF